MYSIGQLSRQADIPTSTVRYYERIGLMEPRGRTASNYRYYTREDLQRLIFIRSAKSMGFALDDISELLAMADEGNDHCVEVQDLVKARLRIIEERLKQTRKIRKTLASFLRRCQEAEGAEACSLLEDLSQISAVDEAN